MYWKIAKIFTGFIRTITETVLCTFIVLKCFDLIQISWFWALSPFLFGVGGGILLLCVGAGIAYFLKPELLKTDEQDIQEQMALLSELEKSLKETKKNDVTDRTDI